MGGFVLESGDITRKCSANQTFSGNPPKCRSMNYNTAIIISNLSHDHTLYVQATSQSLIKAIRITLTNTGSSSQFGDTLINDSLQSL